MRLTMAGGAASAPIKAATEVCRIAGCNGCVQAKNLCWKHYQQLRRTGSTETKRGLGRKPAPPSKVIPSLRERLDASSRHIDETGCIEYTGSRSANGYGSLSVNGKKVYVHRISYLLHIGEIPELMFVCHRCDNPSCVNPGHLFLGSHKDNMADRGVKGRAACGEKSASAKLTEKAVLDIRSRNQTVPQLSIKYGVSKGAIWSVLSRATWAHIC